VTSFTYDERNRLTSGGGATYTYNPRGTINTVTRGSATTTLAYDAFDRLRADGATTYAYDGLGRLASRTAGGATSSSSYATLENDPAPVLNASGTATSEFSRLPDGSPFGIAEGSVGGLAITDAVHDDVVGLLGTASGGSLTGSAAFGPFGEQLGSTRDAGTRPEPWSRLGAGRGHAAGRAGRRPSAGRWLAEESMRDREPARNAVSWALRWWTCTTRCLVGRAARS
jgi:YD repeat-containing protein